MYLKLKKQFIQAKKKTSISISTIAPTSTLIIRNPTSLTINSNITGILLTNSVEKTVPLNLNAPFIYGLTRDIQKRFVIYSTI